MWEFCSINSVVHSQRIWVAYEVQVKDSCELKHQQQSQKFPTILRPFLGQVDNALFKDSLCRRQRRHHHLNHPPSNPPPLSCTIEFVSYNWNLAQVSQNGSCHFAFKSLLMVSRTVGKQRLLCTMARTIFPSKYLLHGQ